MQQRGMYSSTREGRIKVQDIEEDEEEGLDDVWPARMPSSARRYQGTADIRTEVGRAPADVQSLYSQHVVKTSSKSTIPPRRTATQTEIPIIQPSQRRQPTQSVRPVQPVDSDDEIAERHSGQLVLGGSKPRFHWMVFVGLAMFTMVLGWVVLTVVASWWQVTQDDWHYGRPRTYQVDMVVGHNDSAANPTHFVALNLHSHIEIVEFPGGDPSKAKVYVGPTLIGNGQDLTVVTLSFKDVNHDGKVDMIVNIQDSHFVFINENGQFRPARPGENVQV